MLGACLALTAASVTGIGAWQSGRRFALTAASMCVAVVCLVMNNIVSSQPPKPRPTFTLASTVTIKQSASEVRDGDPLISVTPQGCQGTGNVSDLDAGRAVVVADSQGRQVAVGVMQMGKLASGNRNWCVMPFIVRGVPRGLPTYSVTISHRSTVVYTPAGLRAGPQPRSGARAGLAPDAIRHRSAAVAR